MIGRQAALVVENRALRLFEQLARDGVVHVPGLPVSVRRLVGELRRTNRLTTAGLALLFEWRQLLFADGAEQETVAWFVEDRALYARVEAWIAANPYSAERPVALLDATRALEDAALDLVARFPGFYDPDRTGDVED